MIRRKHAIIRTNLYYQLNNLRCDILNRVFDQIDRDLQWSSWYMIAIKAYSATPASIDEDCIRGIMELL